MRKSINLSPRLQAAANMITGSASAADVGCDHGRLSVALLQQGRARWVIASDISFSSLEKADCLAKKCGFGQRMRTVVSDGISHLAPKEADTIVIAGMGGELIARILASSPEAARSADKIVMQPMKGVHKLRRFLRENGYSVRDDILVKDGGRIYQIISAISCEPEPWPQWFPRDEYALGPLLFQKRDPLLLSLLEGYRNGHERRLEKAVEKGGSTDALESILQRIDALIKIAQEACQ